MNKTIFIQLFSNLDLKSIKKLIDENRIKYESLTNSEDFYKRLKTLFKIIEENNNTSLVYNNIICNECSKELALFKGNKSQHFIVLKIKEENQVLVLDNCYMEFPNFNLNSVKLIRAYELMIGIKQPEPDLSPDLFGENESIKQINELSF